MSMVGHLLADCSMAMRADWSFANELASRRPHGLLVKDGVSRKTPVAMYMPRSLEEVGPRPYTTALGL